MLELEKLELPVSVFSKNFNIIQRASARRAILTALETPPGQDGSLAHAQAVDGLLKVGDFGRAVSEIRKNGGTWDHMSVTGHIIDLLIQANRLEEALELVDLLPKWSRDSYLSEVALGYAKSGNWDEAFKIATPKSLKSKENRKFYFSTLQKFCQHLASVQDFDSATRIAFVRIRDVDYQQGAYDYIIEGLIKAGRHEEAFKLSTSIPCGASPSMLSHLSVAFAKGDNLEEALRIAERLNGLLGKQDASFETLKNIYHFLLDQNKFEEALGVALKINDSHLRSMAYKEITQALVKAKEFDRAIQTASYISISSRGFKLAALETICKGLVSDNQVDKANKLADEVFDYTTRTTLKEVIDEATANHSPSSSAPTEVSADH